LKEGAFYNMSLNWDQELAFRQFALQCRICRGTNPYICQCAKEAWLKQQEELKRKRVRPVLSKEEQLEQDWKTHKMLICAPDMEVCTECNSGEWKSFCECAKKKWIEWNKNQKK